MSSRNTSIQLFNILDVVFGTEDLIQCRRFDAYTNCNPIGYGNYITGERLGSRSDGFAFAESDSDFMMWNTIARVDEIKTLQTKLQIIHCPQSLGYICVKLVSVYHKNSRSIFDNNLKCIFMFYKHIICYRDQLLITNHMDPLIFSLLPNMTQKGPSMTHARGTINDIDNDIVFAIRCESWPIIAKEWLVRKREFAWPNKKVIELINKTIGCYVVPVGDKTSPITDIQWRMSFVMSEKCLVHTFNNVQFKVYGMLKLIKSELLNDYTCDDCGENVINSYHMKTVMMWVSENIPEPMWIPERLVLCLRLCLRYLYHFVNIGYLPDYFIPSRNLLKKHSNNDKIGLMRTLGTCIANPLVMFSSLKSLQESILLYFYGLIDTSIGPLTLQAHLNYKTNEVFCYLFSNTIQAKVQPLCITVRLIINHCMIPNEFLYIYKTLLDSLFEKNTSTQKNEQLGVNKAVYLKRRILKQICLKKTHIYITGWLELATYFYVLERYNDTQKICIKVNEMITPSVVYCDELTFATELALKQLQLCDFVKNNMASLVSFYQKNSFHPKELNIEVSKSLLPAIFIEPLRYSYFLSFLCSYHLDNIYGQLASLKNLEEHIYDKSYGFNIASKPSFLRLVLKLFVYNLVGICYEMIGCTEKALDFFRYSLNVNSFPTNPYFKYNPYMLATAIRIQNIESQNM